MFGRKKEVYTIPQERSPRGKSRMRPVPEEPEAEEPELPVGRMDAPEYDEYDQYDDTGFIPDELEPMPAPKAKAVKQKKARKEKAQPMGDSVPFWKNKKKVGIFLVAASLLVLLVVSPVLNYLTATKTAVAVVATEAIPQGTQITQEMIAPVEVPEATLLPVHMKDQTLVIGRYAGADIVQDELITTPKISETIPYSNSYLYTLPAGKKAVSVTIPSLAAGLSGKLQAGDIVSLYVALFETGDEDKETDKVSFTATLLPELTYVQVLATTNLDGYDVTGNVEDEALEVPLPSTVTLAVNDAQAALLAGLETKGALHAALVVRGDAALTASYLTLQEDYFLQLEKEKQEADENSEDEAGTEADAQEPAEAEPVQPPAQPAPAPKPQQPASQAAKPAASSAPETSQTEETSGGDTQ